jgi:hypothetical protein
VRYDSGNKYAETQLSFRREVDLSIKKRIEMGLTGFALAAREELFNVLRGGPMVVSKNEVSHFPQIIADCY